MTSQDIKNIIDSSICINKSGKITAKALNETMKSMVDFTTGYVREEQSFVDILRNEDWIDTVAHSPIGSVFFIEPKRYFAINVDGTQLNVKRKAAIPGTTYFCIADRGVYTWNVTSLTRVMVLEDLEEHAADTSLHLEEDDRLFLNDVRFTSQQDITDELIKR